MCSSLNKYLSAKATKDTLEFLKVIYIFLWIHLKRPLCGRNLIGSSIDGEVRSAIAFSESTCPFKNWGYISSSSGEVCATWDTKRGKLLLKLPCFIWENKHMQKIITASIWEGSAKCCGSWWGREMTIRCAQESSKLQK